MRPRSPLRSATNFMPAGMKQKTPVLITVCVIIIMSHYLNLYWLAMPVLHPNGVPTALLWIDVAAMCFVTSTCAIWIRAAMRRHAIFPVHDPRLHDEGHGAPAAQH